MKFSATITFLLMFVLHNGYKAKCEIATTGSFFQKVENADEKQLKSDEVFLTPQIFNCERKNTCFRVVREKTSHNTYSNAEEKSLEGHSSYGEWQKVTVFKDCRDLYDNGKRESGVYNVTRPNKQVLKVYCDMETDGGGWTVIQRRNDGSTDFNRGWSDYKHGFGDVEKNMWIGLENMHSLAGLNSNTTLRIELKHRLKGDELFFAKYGSFKIGNETDGYRIRVSGYSGTAGDAFKIQNAHSITKNNGMEFSTKNRDNDLSSDNCAEKYNGGWWYNACHSCQLNGLLPSTDTNSPGYMSWITIDGSYGSIKFSEMKIRHN
ncbi:fibrinogen C domain-containing protein 1-like [Rhopilema esculentum]|uniref:fibrinogen C domain-containing protein 1-like n=1 Tax=Rhopilema esculentum TaxID=499914 RepID=UPI0031D43CA9